VSSWVNQIIRAFPDIRFAIVFLGSRRSDYGAPKYAIPANVVHVETHFLHDDIVKVEPHAKPTPRKGDTQAYADVAKLHDGFKGNPGGLEAFARIARELQPGGRLTVDDFLHSEASWEMIAERYRHYCTDPSFVDYFWTVRIMHQPLWLLGKVAHQLIPVKAVHSISTGYAGFLGALIARSRGIPLVLSEHGIYTKERKIDLYQNEWIRDNRNVFQKDPADLSYFRQMWIRFFEWLGRLTYDAADPIIALYEANRLRQVADGALAERTFCIPNGISLARLSPLRELQPASPPPVLCLIGRVVPIKDIKTFIRAMRRVVNLMPEAEGWIAGPEDEDPATPRNAATSPRASASPTRSSFWASSASTRSCPRSAR
jgi:glycosyltransferase involved in cell wall biosynthesis